MDKEEYYAGIKKATLTVIFYFMKDVHSQWEKLTGLYLWEALSSRAFCVDGNVFYLHSPMAPCSFWVSEMWLV